MRVSTLTVLLDCCRGCGFAAPSIGSRGRPRQRHLWSWPLPRTQVRIGRPFWCGGADTATKSRDKSASLGVERRSKYNLDCDGLGVVPLTATVQALRKLSERSVLRQHERKRSVFERHRHAAWPRF